MEKDGSENHSHEKSSGFIFTALYRIPLGHIFLSSERNSDSVYVFTESCQVLFQTDYWSRNAHTEDLTEHNGIFFVMLPSQGMTHPQRHFRYHLPFYLLLLVGFPKKYVSFLHGF